MAESRWLRLAIGLAAWTLIGVSVSMQTFIGATYTQRPLEWSEGLAVGLAAWYVRAALSPVAILVARRLPIIPAHLARRVATHIAAGLAWALLATAAIEWVSTRIVDASAGAPWLVELYTSLLTYIVLVGLTQGAESFRRRRDAEITALRLEARLATARLDLLRMQLNPQFLASALRDIAEAIHRDVTRAERMVEELTEMVRLSSRYVGEQEVPLSEEVGFLRRYLRLEQMRSRDRLETHFDIESDALSARVPYLILQPLVENAVRHGASPHVGRGRVEVRGRADGEALVLEVYDDGPGSGSHASEERGRADLRNTRDRLRESYGESHRLEVADVAGGGLCVRLELPLRRTAMSSPTVRISGSSVAS
jgi:two-component system, LytTR family, sensor kinase